MLTAKLEKRGHATWREYPDMARAYGLLRDAERTFFWLEKAFDEHNPDLIELLTEPSFDGLRSNAKFVQLLRRIGFDVAESQISPSQ